ncbi:MAG: hypothetical protein J7577_13415 [Sphingobacteriaceae bacterium]|nr:hypothetical protein [Sphingobacteriaceae bacterium]
MAHKKLPATAKRKALHVQFNPEEHQIKQDAADRVPMYIPELKMTVMAKPGTSIKDLKDKYINNKPQRLNKGGNYEKKGFIKF